jgi:hypothetical protein
MPEFETAGGGAGEGAALAAGRPCAIWLGALQHRDRVDAISMLERLSIRHRRIDHHACHGAQAAGESYATIATTID